MGSNHSGLGAGVAYSIFKFQDMSKAPKKIMLPSSPREVMDVEKAHPSDPDFTRKIEEEIKPLVTSQDAPKLSQLKGTHSMDSVDDDL